MRFLIVPAAIVVATAVSLHAAPLTEARIARIINDVSVVKPVEGARAATLNELVKEDAAVKTGIKSRSELLFQDDTLTRLGPESFFSFKPGTRDMSLEQGTMLLQVPKGHGGAKIRTAAVTAAITGTTIMLEHLPRKSLKVLVLEGSLRLSINGRFGDSLLLLPGKMVIMPPNAKRIPEPVSVDLAKVLKTSALVKMGGEEKPLPSMGLILAEIEVQSKSKLANELLATNLTIDGAGTTATAKPDPVVIAIDAKENIDDVMRVATARPETPGTTPTPLPSATPTSSVSPTPTASPSVTASPSPGASVTPTPSASPTPGGGGDEDEDDDDAKYQKVVKIDSGKDSDDVVIDSPINVSSAGRTGKVKVNAKGSVTVNTTIKVSEAGGSKSSKFGGRIDIRSQKKTGTAISVSSSSELLALLDSAAAGPGGLIKLQSNGGAINVSGKVQADRGRIDIKNTGNNGEISLSGATLSADTIKVRTLGNDGQLNIGGGTISADTLIYLYSGGSNGQVNFTDNVTLSGKSVKTIAGNTVTIRDGKVVTINGPAPANVFTDRPNYTGSGGNGSTTGVFAGQGATTQPLSKAPGQ